MCMIAVVCVGCAFDYRFPFARGYKWDVNWFQLPIVVVIHGSAWCCIMADLEVGWDPGGLIMLVQTWCIVVCLSCVRIFQDGYLWETFYCPLCIVGLVCAYGIVIAMSFWNFRSRHCLRVIWQGPLSPCLRLVSFIVRWGGVSFHSDHPTSMFRWTLARSS